MGGEEVIGEKVMAKEQYILERDVAMRGYEVFLERDDPKREWGVVAYGLILTEKGMTMGLQPIVKLVIPDSLLSFLREKKLI